MDIFVVSANKPLKFNAPSNGSYFTIRQATLEGDYATQLFITVDSKTVLLCTLSLAVPQHTIQLAFNKDIELTVVGKCSIHVAINYNKEIGVDPQIESNNEKKKKKMYEEAEDDLDDSGDSSDSYDLDNLDEDILPDDNMDLDDESSDDEMLNPRYKSKSIRKVPTKRMKKH
ncbi:hypothetical protein EIN_229390 [Entamoeba invadens IP1]|uniref:Nucleoplasmin-like domain-containing protein n=1 Tax=Entamoeba invadens IP1 TaxID=370355 RepID=A0A0A1U2X5_ENTIV|nr:hypothetical protein EIN_229390 [Entamoeba invadens IP1]ELP88416.1 hypothetical protein EIN_229390 [Entamoeba invadens IP1]|eukprot:XP_004255187.1 hypothetical protein EIN_229390 [Entamoeba invadens IP1]